MNWQVESADLEHDHLNKQIVDLVFLTNLGRIDEFFWKNKSKHLQFDIDWREMRTGYMSVFNIDFFL